MQRFKKTILLFLILFSVSVIAQNETNNWYFGDYAGLNFSDGILNTLNNSGMSTPAGCSSISDKNGDLLFYTNGVNVWNRNHEIMDNGFELAAEINNTQTSIIIPKPNSEEIYYIFTTRVYGTTSNPFFSSGVYYSEIEVSNQHPLGSVTIKNIKLISSSSEKITAIHDWENNIIKVLAFASTSSNADDPKDTFFIFNVTENGVMRDPIMSKQDEVLLAGPIKISPNGEYIAVVGRDNYIYLYNFNINNSTINFNRTINPHLIFNPLNVYGLEFSQDSEMLYFAGTDIYNIGRLYKYEINSTSILNEKISIQISPEYNFGSLQLARNGKIYMAAYIENNPLTSLNNISVINNPNSLEDIDYKPLAINLESGNSFKGLPNFIPSFFRNRIITENKCENEDFNFSVDAFNQVDTVIWDFDDGSTTSTEINPTHQYTIAGKYIIKANITINNYSTTLFKEIEVYPLPRINANQTLLQCDLDTDGVSYFNLFNIENKIINPNPDYELSFFNTENDALNNQNFIVNPELFENTSNPQEIYVKIISPKGCETISNFFIETTYARLGDIDEMFTCDYTDDILNNSEGEFNLREKERDIRNDFNIPDKSTLTFYQSFQDAQTKTNPVPLYHITATTTVWVRVDNENSGCHGIEPIQLTVNNGIALNIEDSYTLCKKEINPSIYLDGGITNDNWEWKDELDNIISTNSEIEITTPGNYSITVTKSDNNLECVYTKQFTILDSDAPTFNQITVNDQEVKITINGNSEYEFSLDNITYTGEGTIHTFNHVKAGTHTIYLKDKYNCEPTITTEIALIGFPDFFTPNNDGYNDTWKILGLSPNLYLSAKIYIYDRYGKILYSMNINTNDEGWSGLYNGEILSSSSYWFNATLIDKENNTIVKTGHFSLVK